MSPECIIAEDHNCPHAVTCGSHYGIVYSVAKEVRHVLKELAGLTENRIEESIRTNPTWTKEGFDYTCLPEKPERSEIEDKSGR